ncbi:MAG: hypothetical protein AB7G12_00815 [Thermoanaerobaculia bacterium]
MERVAVRRSAVRKLRLLLALALLVTALPRALPAATYVITTLAEDTTNNGNCTLREALLAASTDSTNDQCIGDVGADTIVLDAVGTYSLVTGTVLSATRTLTIRGDGDHPASDYVVELGNAQRLLHVLGNSTLILENFSLRHGFSSATGGALFAEDSDLTLRGMEIRLSAAVDGAGVGFLSHGGKTLDVEDSVFENNATTGSQAAGAGLDVNLQSGGTVRIVGSRFLGNSIVTASGSFARTGAGLSITSFAPAAVEIRHVDFSGNTINAPSFASGAGAYLSLGNQTGGNVLLEDLDFRNNSFGTFAGSNSDVALHLSADDGTISARRVTMLANLGGTTRAQGSISLTGTGQATVSDMVVGNGNGWGLFLITSGTATLLAGNLTVAGQADDGLVLAENGGTLRVENSIVFGNATSSGSNVHLFSGTPDVSAENLIGVDPQFVSPGNGDFRLGPTSVAADAGNQTFLSVGPFDAAHGERILGVQLDLGALERGAIFSDDFEKNELFAWSSTTP